MQKILNNLRYDLPASVVVFFVALPLCLGVALASGAPLLSGIISGIVGGIICGKISGSQLGVSGPAAGLAIIVFNYITALGSFESFLVATMLAGIIQIIMGSLKLGTIAYYFPSSVIKGMLCGIGIIIIIKQIPHALGYDTNIAKDFENYLDQSIATTFNETIQNLTPNAIIISIISLTILIVWENYISKKVRKLKILPAPLIVVVIGIIMSKFVDLANHQIVQLPLFSDGKDFLNQISRPNFEALKNPAIYEMALVIAIVASIETLLCVEATDKLDPMKRITPTNLELKAQGISNFLSGLFGGLPITQVIVRSSANISFGAKSKNSTILHGFFLLICALAIPNILNMIPLASLASILLIVGYKLSHPKIFLKTYKLGYEQFIPFITTIIAMIVFDLLKGVMLGMLISVIFILLHNFRNAYERTIDQEGKNHQHFINLAEEVSFLNKGAILQLLNNIPENSRVTIDGTKSKIIDYDIYEIIKDFQSNAKSKSIELTLKGINLNKI